MLVRRRLSWFRMLLVMKGSVLPRIIPHLVITALMGVWAVIAADFPWPWHLGFTPAPFSFLGVSLAIFLGFRNSASYDRWWEGRKIWGALVIHTRSIARQVVGLIDNDARSRRMIHLVIAFTHALRHQLRNTDPTEDLKAWVEPALLDELLSARFRPAAILVALERELQAARRAGEINPVLIPALEQTLGFLSEVLAASERVHSAPIPFTYAVIVHRTVFLFCYMLPFGLAHSVGLLTPIITAAVAYPFLALEALAQELEDPFGTAPNALPLCSICETIEHSLRETLGERGLRGGRYQDEFFIY